MRLQVKCGEIDRNNDPVGEPKTIASFDDRSAAEAFIEEELKRFDHNGFVPDGHQAGWWGRNDRDPYEKFHFWIDGGSGIPEPLKDRQYRGIP